MIHLVDDAIEAFLRAAVPLSDAAIDVSFDAPDRTWGAAVTRPTVNLFLWDVKRDGRLSTAGRLERNDDEGNVDRRRTSPAIGLSYFVTAWATTSRDEHQLLGSVLRAFLANTVLPAEHVPDALHPEGIVTMSVAVMGDRKPGEFWSALDGRLKPGIELDVGVSVEIYPWVPAAPLTEALQLGVAPMLPPEDPEPAEAELAAVGRPPLRRTRRNGALLMEGRSDEPGGVDDPSVNGG